MDLRLRYGASRCIGCSTAGEIFGTEIIDITAREQAEAALQESENRLTDALEATSEGLWDWTIETGEVRFSPQWARLLGYEPKEVPQRVEFFLAAVHPEDVDRVKAVLNDHLAGKTAVKVSEARLRMKSGEFLWVLDRGKVVAWDAAGKPVRMVGTIANIAERRRAQDALEASLPEKVALLKEVHSPSQERSAGRKQPPEAGERASRQRCDSG